MGLICLFTENEIIEWFVAPLLIVLGALLIFVIVTFVLTMKSHQKYENKLKDSSTGSTIYVIDVINDQVLYFHKSDLKNKKKINLSSFYDRFHENDIGRVKDWILEICSNPKSADQYLEVDVVSSKSKNKKTMFALLKLIKYDPKKQLLHIESQVLKYITPNHYVTKKSRNVPTGVVKRSQMNQLILKEKSLRGYTFAIRFFYVRQKVLSNDKIERYMTMTLKNEVFPFASNTKEPRQIINDNDSEIILFDLRIANPQDAMRLASSVEHNLKKCIGVNGYADSINFSIGIVENSQFYQDFEKMVDKAQETCMNAQQNGQNILLYKKSINQVLELEKYSQQIDNLLEPNQMRYLFRPIVNAEKKRIFGYFAYIKAYNSPFTSVEEMSKYASMVGKNRDLFATIAKNLIPKFKNERPNEYCSLFFSVSLVDIDHIIDILPQINETKETRIVLVFDEQEINENASQLDLLNNSLEKLHENHFQLALSMRDRNLLLDSSLYYNFDYFVTGAAMVSEIKKNNRVRLSIHTLVEQLLKYDKPIIATDLESWQGIELLIKSGLTLLSSEVISGSNDMLLPIEKKKLDKLAAMANSYH